MSEEEANKEFQRRRINYFEARDEYNDARREEIQNTELLLHLAERYGFTKALYADFKERHKHQITVNG